jgi:hypothetical protein
VHRGERLKIQRGFNITYEILGNPSLPRGKKPACLRLQQDGTVIELTKEEREEMDPWGLKLLDDYFTIKKSKDGPFTHHFEMPELSKRTEPKVVSYPDGSRYEGKSVLGKKSGHGTL